MRTWLVTGGAGFIGSNFIRYMLQVDDSLRIVNLDKLTYAGNLESLSDVEANVNYTFIRGDIGDRIFVDGLLMQYQPDAVINFAAESHVDRSIDGPALFIETNVVGTFNLLESLRTYWINMSEVRQKEFRFLHVSTDEVFGSLGKLGYFTENTPYAPNSPYSASKAGSDHLVRAYFHTYGLPSLITNCSNNYGPYQFPEKLIPLMILNALDGKHLSIYGDGQNVRDWIYVIDHCNAIRTVIEKGKPGESYNIGGNNEKTNVEVVNTLCNLLDEMCPRPDGQSYKLQIKFVNDRPGHDRRYAIDSSKIQNDLGWKPQETFKTGMQKTVQWYIQHQNWCQNVCDGKYRRERLGTA